MAACGTFPVRCPPSWRQSFDWLKEMAPDFSRLLIECFKITLNNSMNFRLTQAPDKKAIYPESDHSKWTRQAAHFWGRRTWAQWQWMGGRPGQKRLFGLDSWSSSAQVWGKCFYKTKACLHFSYGRNSRLGIFCIELAAANRRASFSKIICINST